MRYVQAALACEGPTDPRFLCSVVHRAVQEMAVEVFSGAVEIPEVLPVRLADGRLGNEPAQVVAAFARRDVFADLLVVHADAAGDPGRMETSIVEAIARGLGEADISTLVVGALPQREPEAWMLTDPDAIARCLGVAVDSVRPSRPAAAVHKILDPKAEMRDLVARAVASTSRRRRRAGHRADALYGALGDEIDLDALRRAPSYRTFGDRLRRRLAPEENP